MTNFCQEKVLISHMKLSDRKEPTDYEHPMGGERHNQAHVLVQDTTGHVVKNNARMEDIHERATASQQRA